MIKKNDLLEKIYEAYASIRPTKEAKGRITKTLRYLDIPDDLITEYMFIRKNPLGKGLALECLFFDKYKYYDMILANDDFEIFTIPIKNIAGTQLTFYPEKKKVGQDEIITGHRITLKVILSGSIGVSGLGYSLNDDKMEEILAIKKELQKLI